MLERLKMEIDSSMGGKRLAAGLWQRGGGLWDEEGRNQEEKVPQN